MASYCFGTALDDYPDRSACDRRSGAWRYYAQGAEMLGAERLLNDLFLTPHA